MNLEKVCAIFVLAEIPVETFHQLANHYWPDVIEYADVRRENPWWLAETNYGLVKIGWRKRVISIDWEATPIRAEVTAANVTKSDTMVHAWSYADAVKYLYQWRTLAEAFNPPLSVDKPQER